MDFALLGIGGILLFPASATYHFLLLSVPVAVLLASVDKEWSHEQGILVALYALIGFIPYSLIRQFDGQGLMTFIAYPRLFLMLAMFVVSVRLVSITDVNRFNIVEELKLNDYSG